MIIKFKTRTYDPRWKLDEKQQIKVMSGAHPTDVGGILELYRYQEHEVEIDDDVICEILEKLKGRTCGMT